MPFIPVPLHSKLNVDLLVNVVVKLCELNSQVVCAASWLFLSSFLKRVGN